ncbi:MAG: P-type conjugative transfer protein VirB9 [Rickettsia sp.]|nr:P-type conjugative transfer protein VirB9 [Rickettsia sp.]
MKKIIMQIFFVYCTLQPLYAVIEPRPLSIDQRIKVINYQPDAIFKFVGYYNYQSTIELEKSEEVVSISMGDTTSWQIVPSGNLIFIKPVENFATTNMTLITNKRNYIFELFAENATDIRDPNITFSLKFLYSEAQNLEKTTNQERTNLFVDLEKPEELNFFYSISGDEEIAPVKIFDDGEFTYMQFRSRNSEIPAMFSVGTDQQESLVNFKIDPNNNNKKYIIIERVYPKLTLRLGEKILCIFNEAYFI